MMKEVKQRITARQWLMISLYGVLMSSVSLTCLAAIPLMPIGDLIVLCFTSPVFAVFFEFLILRRPIKVFTLALCALIGEIFTKYSYLTLQATPSSAGGHSGGAALLHISHH